MKPSADNVTLLCPSARSDMPGSMIIGVAGGTAERPQVRYLGTPRLASPDTLALAGPLAPEEVFRLAAPCATTACVHFDGCHCRLAQRVSRIVPLTVSRLPPCGIRRECRWYAEQGAAACLRCPAIVTHDYAPSEAARAAAVRR